MSPRSARTCSAVLTTPLVVEYETAMVSRSHGAPVSSFTPPHTSTTQRPRWYTHTAAPPFDFVSCASSWCATGSKPRETSPWITGRVYSPADVGAGPTCGHNLL